MNSEGWIDRFARSVSPQWYGKRLRSRITNDLLVRHFEGASQGRRTQGWKRSSADANAALSGGLSRLRDHARDLERNNSHAKSAVRIIGNHTVGWGIVADSDNRAAHQAWMEWAETTACDAEGRNDIYGLEKLTMKTVATSGEALVRRRIRRPEDGLPLPIQLQVLEPDYIDTDKTNFNLPNRGRIINGIEFDAIGRRAAYWLFPEHPGSEALRSSASQRVPAESIVHVFRQDRPGQVRGVSWFAPVLLPLKDFDEYTDAQGVKQKVSACLAAILTDPNGLAQPLGTASAQDSNGATPLPELDMIGPGWVGLAPPGRDVRIIEPPSVDGYAEYCEVTERRIATGLGVPYEDLTGNYGEMSFSAARMARLSHWQDVEDWRWQMLIPQFCTPVWNWAMQAAVIMGRISESQAVEWTAPPLPMIDPSAEGLAYRNNIRGGIMSLSEALRERGYNPRTVLKELASDFALLDKLGLILDSDPRHMTQAGQFQSEPKEELAEKDEPMILPPKKPNGKPIAVKGVSE